MANGSERSSGVITRRRTTKDRTEESIIDLVLLSNDVVPNFVSLKVDEERKHVITRITKTKKGIKTKESDHNVLWTEFDFKVNEITDKPKIELYNLKNKENQKSFKEYTSKNNALSSIFESEDNLDKLTERFVHKLNGCISMNFRKIRTSTREKPTCTELFDKMRSLKGKDDPKNKKELEKVKAEIAEASKRNLEIIKEEISKMKPNKGS